MKFYDLHVHSAFSEGESTVAELASRARELGYAGICFSEYFSSERRLGELRSEIARVQKEMGIRIFLGFEARNPEELRRLANIRREFDVLLAHGGDMDMNRAAVETAEVDVLTHPEAGRFDCGMNHVMAKLARQNNVAIEVNMRGILMSSGKTRSRILSNMKDNVELGKKYRMPMIVCSGAISHWEMRDPLCLSSMAEQLGLPIKVAKDTVSSVPESILNQAIERRGKDWIMPGVKVVKREY
jgi:ribonuclease P/MRP protein subunit RPP1